MIVNGNEEMLNKHQHQQVGKIGAKDSGDKEKENNKSKKQPTAEEDSNEKGSEEEDDDGEEESDAESEIENFFRLIEDEIGSESEVDEEEMEKKKRLQKQQFENRNVLKSDCEKSKEETSVVGKANNLCNMGKRIINALKASNSDGRTDYCNTKDMVNQMGLSVKFKEDDDGNEKGNEQNGKQQPMSFDPANEVDFFAERERCLKEKRLFEDPTFAATKQSIFFTAEDKLEGLKQWWTVAEWKRPAELAKEPFFINNGFQRSDVVQGVLNNCWMVASIANLTQHPALFYRVVSPDQGFNNNYAGIFHFKLWRYGTWVDVVVDDRLPCVKDNDGNYRLLFMRSDDPSEFWSALLEKAFAKVYGTYEALEYGQNSEALEDLTGGIVESHVFNLAPRTLLKKVQRGLQLGNIYGCISGDQEEGILSNGIVKAHAYSVTMMQKVRTSWGQQVHLWRLRNPHGQQEWNRAWADESTEWKKLSQKERRRLEHKVKDDGEFWMAYKDVCTNFQAITICNIGPEVLDDVLNMTRHLDSGILQQQTKRSTWQTKVLNGRCSQDKGPDVYTFTVDVPNCTPPEEGKELPRRSTTSRCSLIVALMQKYRREQKHAGLNNLDIGLYIYKQHYGGGLKELSNRKNFVVGVGPENVREITISCNLTAGNYLLVPFIDGTDQNNDEDCCDYMIRIFSTAPIKSSVLQQ